MAKEEKLYTLTELSKLAGVSMPTLQRYKKQYQSRIPSVGKGRSQRYPEAAIEEVRKIKSENLKKRGRPRKKGKKAASPRKTASRRTARAAKGGGRGRKSTGGGELLTLTEIGRRTGISYPTLVRYVKLHLNEIPHEGSGRKRRFPVEAIKVFERLRGASKRGRKPRSKKPAARRGVGTDRALAQRIRKLESAQKSIARQLDSVISLLKKPVRVTIEPQSGDPSRRRAGPVGGRRPRSPGGGRE